MISNLLRVTHCAYEVIAEKALVPLRPVAAIWNPHCTHFHGTSAGSSAPPHHPTTPPALKMDPRLGPGLHGPEPGPGPGKVMDDDVNFSVFTFVFHFVLELRNTK